MPHDLLIQKKIQHQNNFLKAEQFEKHLPDILWQELCQVAPSYS